MLTYEDKKLLLEGIENDMMDESVLESLENMKKKKVDTVHHLSITSPKKEGGLWQTFVKKEDGKRKKITARSEDVLYQKLYNHYYIVDVLPITELFPKWIEKKISQNLADASIRRYENFWNKYYVDSKIVSVSVDKITIRMVEDFFHAIIKNQSITKKEFDNMKYLFKDIIWDAKHDGLTTFNAFEEADIKTFGCEPANHENDDSRVYLPKEKMKMFTALNKEISERPSVTDMHAIFLLFKLGLRIGEVVALKKSDICYSSKTIHVQRMVRLKKDTDTVLREKIVNYTKKRSPWGNRYLPLDNYEFELIEKVLEVNEKFGFKDDDYLFIDENGRTKKRAIDNRIRKMCSKANIPVKSSHDIRRTVASEMHTNGVPIEVIRAYLGHSDIETTWGYIYNNQDKEQTARIIRDSLNKMNGLNVS